MMDGCRVLELAPHGGFHLHYCLVLRSYGSLLHCCLEQSVSRESRGRLVNASFALRHVVHLLLVLLQIATLLLLYLL